MDTRRNASKCDNGSYRPQDILAFLRYANLKPGDIQRLVGRKTEPIPYISFTELKH